MESTVSDAAAFTLDMKLRYCATTNLACPRWHLSLNHMIAHSRAHSHLSLPAPTQLRARLHVRAHYHCASVQFVVVHCDALLDKYIDRCTPIIIAIVIATTIKLTYNKLHNTLHQHTAIYILPHGRLHLQLHSQLQPQLRPPLERYAATNPYT